MKLKYLFIPFLLLLPLFIFAQGFQKHFTGHAWEVQNMVTESGGAFAFTGEFKPAVASNSICVNFGRMNANGTIMQMSKICPSLTCSVGGMDLRQSTGGFLISGYADCSDSSKLDGLLIKLSPSGALQWSGRYGGNEPDMFRAMEVMYDGGYLMAGYSESYFIGGTQSRNMYVVRTDTNGILLTGYVYGWTDPDEAFDLIATRDSNALVVGFVTNRPQGAQPEEDLYMVKTTPFGGPMWRIRYDIFDDDRYHSVVEDPFSGHFFFTGRTDSAGLIRPFLLETDPAGNAVNLLVYSHPDGHNAEGNQIRLDPATGEIIIVGSAISGNDRGFTLRCGPQGNPLFWSMHEGEGLKTFAFAGNQEILALGNDTVQVSPGNTHDLLYALRVSPVGISDSLCNDDVRQPPFLLGLPTGVMLPDTFFYGEDQRGLPMWDSAVVVNPVNLCLMSGVEEENELSEVTVAPNPFSDFLRVNLNFTENQGWAVQLTDLQGREHFKQTGFGLQQKLEIPTGNLAKGMYLLRVQQGKSFRTQKVLRQ